MEWTHMMQKKHDVNDKIAKAQHIHDPLLRANALYSLGVRPNTIPFIRTCLKLGFTLEHEPPHVIETTEADEPPLAVTLKKNGVSCSPRFLDLYDLELHCWKNMKQYDALSKKNLAG